MIKRISLLLLALVIGVCFVGVYLNQHVKTYLAQPVSVSAPTLFTVERGASRSQILGQLAEQQMAKPLGWSRQLLLRHPSLSGLRAGTYQIQPHSTLADVLALLRSGKEHQFSITFVEGSRFAQWRAQLDAQPYLKHTITSLSDTQVMAALGESEHPPEGMFFPDTYYFTANSDDLAILKRAYRRMTQALAQQWQARKQGGQLDSPYEALILASIVEKESAHVPEMPNIASVFHNRLQKRMRLQTDPTVIYGLGETFDGNITRAHLRQKTAFNTYVIRGLPPTPIAMPGAKALEAVMQPTETRYFYFVSRGDGTHVFSKTLAEHNRNVRRYQLNR